LHRIRSEFGFSAYVRTLVLVFGLPGIAIIGIALFGRFEPLVIIFVGLIAGMLFRRQIANRTESLSALTNVGLFIYGVVLFFGDLLKIDGATKIAIIALTTVIVFNFQFWSLSDPDVYNPERESGDR
jgi:hypothetical protein